MAYNVIKATLGFEPIETNPSYDYTFPQNQSYDVTNGCKTFLGSKKLITINSSQSSFGYDVHEFASSEIDMIRNNPSFSSTSQVKLIIQMHDNEENKVYIFVFIRNKGWVIRDEIGTKIEVSESPQEQIMISQNGYHSISSGEDAAGAAATIADLFNLSPAQKAALTILARKSGTNTSSLIAKAIEFAKDKAPFAFAEASIRFDRTESDEATKQLQRCLIRIAGGNLESERKHLRGPSYPIFSARWRAEYGPIFPKADNGYYVDDTRDAIRQLKPFIDSIQPGLIRDNAMEVKSSILTSPVCAGLIGDVTAEERRNSRSKTPMPVPAVNQQNVPEVIDVPKPAPTAPAAKPTPAAATKPQSLKDMIDYNNLPQILKYGQLPEYKDLLNFVKKQNNKSITNQYNNLIDAIDAFIFNLKNQPTNANKQRVIALINDYIVAFKKPTRFFSEQDFEDKTELFLYAFLRNVESLNIENLAPKQESKIYKDYNFLSTKNNKLHSILMEQLKKDLKRG